MSSQMTVRGTGLALGSGPSVLGEKTVRIPTIGKVHPGIKVLTPAATNPDTTKIYLDGVARGLRWDAIEKELRKTLGPEFTRSPLTPRNTPYFSVYRSDFAMGETADFIMDEYGEDRGQGRHLYRFPIMLSIDSWLAVLPHGMKCHTGAGLKYWSEYGADNVRYCKTLGVLEKDPQSQRYIKPEGGRPVVVRSDNGGLCVPEKCAEYQLQTCKLKGSFLFHIPGVPGNGFIELPLTSFYGLQGIRQQLELMLYLRGTLKVPANAPPIFWVTKQEREISMLDLKTGLAKPVKQWITVVESTADMTKMLSAPDDGDDVDEVVTISHAEADELPDDQARDEGLIEDAEFTEAEPVPSVPQLQASIREQVTRGLRIEKWAEFAAYADERWRDGWREDYSRLLDILEEVRNVKDRDLYYAKVLEGIKF